MIKLLNDAGLGYRTRNDDVVDKIGDIPLREVLLLNICMFIRCNVCLWIRINKYPQLQVFLYSSKISHNNFPFLSAIGK